MKGASSQGDGSVTFLKLYLEYSMLDCSQFVGLTEKYDVGLDELLAEIQGYGFMEISDIKYFISVMARLNPTACEYLYIREKLALCLINHDNGADYFIPLRHLVASLNYFLRELRGCSQTE